MISAMRRIMAQSGARGLYAGLGVTLVAAAPGTCVYFTYATPRHAHAMHIARRSSAPPLAFSSSLGRVRSYEWAKKNSPVSSPFARELVAGFLAETVSCVIWVPFDVVKERLQVQSLLKQPSTTPASSVAGPTPSVGSSGGGLMYRGSWDALRTIARTEGLRGLYRGYGATLFSYGPFSAMYLAGNLVDCLVRRSVVSGVACGATGADTLENWCRQRMGIKAGGELPWYAHVASGTTASSVAAFISTPVRRTATATLPPSTITSLSRLAVVVDVQLDLAKLRMQVQRGNMGFTFGYRNIADGLHKIYSADGVPGLWRGAGARVASMAPMCALTWSLNGIIRERLQSHGL